MNKVKNKSYSNSKNKERASKAKSRGRKQREKHLNVPLQERITSEAYEMLQQLREELV